jgi:hypothetical protein
VGGAHCWFTLMLSVLDFERNIQFQVLVCWKFDIASNVGFK